MKDNCKICHSPVNKMTTIGTEIEIYQYDCGLQIQSIVGISEKVRASKNELVYKNFKKHFIIEKCKKGKIK